MAKPSPNIPYNEVDYSASATLIYYDHPLPLLRGPIPAGPTDDPNLGPYVLAFPTQQSFFSSFKFCQSKLREQCESGLRIGCSLIASEKCKPPWWKTLSGKVDFKERSACEEREMVACLQDSKEKCETFALEKSLDPFKWARIAAPKKKMGKKEVGRLISWVSGLGFWNGNQSGLLYELNLSSETMYYRGSEIMGDENQLN
ncbi:uncharacterized protein LOC130798554 [Amaranthus tricolor]|uniref:uncharacterized protein LOC130798554 n=1 Tax=Amaranthus tricolor TaxID=29722 RepID=UPI002586F699|nr:uncharacterized protein LOC130798554 [Amaranthus tricolor]